MSRALALIALFSLGTACDDPHGWFQSEPRFAQNSDLCVGFPDFDQDGFGVEGSGERALECAFVAQVTGDCNDADATIHPDAEEFCDGVDSNCDGQSDSNDPRVLDAELLYRDIDGDGYGGQNEPGVMRCPADGWVSNALDCDDSRAAIKPGAAEVCDGVDNDCDGLIDVQDPDILTDDASNLWFSDLDADGYGNPAAFRCFELAGFVQDNSDCNDSDASINPSSVERCDDIDHDCSGAPDDIVGVVDGYVDSDGDGWGSATVAGTVSSCVGGGLVGRSGDCDDANPNIYPGAPDIPYDGVMNDCLQPLSADCDADGDGYYSQECSSIMPYDCDESDPLIHPGAIQLNFDGVDNNCDGDTGAGSEHAAALHLQGVGAEIASADLSGDGVLQLLSLRDEPMSGDGTTLLLWPAELSGSSSPVEIATFPTARKRTFTAAMDLDRDGAQDLLLFSRSNSRAEITQIGGGLLPGVVTGLAQGGQQFLAVSDVQHDGWGDVFSTLRVAGNNPELRRFALQDFDRVVDIDWSSPTETFSLNVAAVESTDLNLGMVGDMNGDGLEEVVVGVPEKAGISGSHYGHRQVLQGPSYQWDDGVGYSGQTPNTYFGAVSALGQGDLNGDGYADDLSAAVYPISSERQAAELFSYQGAGDLFSGGGNLSYSRWVMPNLGSDVQLILRWAGDVDGDGTDDFWVGFSADDVVQGGDSTIPSTGAHLVLGGPTVYNGYLTDARGAQVTPMHQEFAGLASGLALIDYDHRGPLDLVLAQDNGQAALLFTGSAP